jgi:flagellar protein FliS
MSNGVLTYRKTDTMGKSQLDLIVEVYDGAIKAFKKAVEAFESDKWEAAQSEMEQARRCVTHLYTTLDMDQGGDVADQLGKLYTFVISQCDIAAATKDEKLISSNIQVLSNLRDGWLSLKDKQIESPSEPAPAAAPVGNLNTSG